MPACVRSYGRPLLAWILTIILVWVATACAATGTPGVERTGTYVMTEVELQAELMGFADRFATIMIQALEDFQLAAPSPDLRRIVLEDTIYTIASAYTIAAEPNPDVALLDMVAMVTLGRMIYEEHWLAQIGSKLEPVIKGLRKAEDDIWRLAARLLNNEQQEELNGIIVNWRRSNPEVLYFSYLRFHDFAAPRKTSTLAQSRQISGIFRSVQQATQEVEEARLLAERTLFLATRMPLLAGYFADIWLSQVGQNPQAKDLMTNMERVASVAEKMAALAEKLPDQLAARIDRVSRDNIQLLAALVAAERQSAIKQLMAEVGKERHQAIQDLVSEEERLGRMAADLRSALEESTRFMASLNQFMGHIERQTAANEGDEDPFDIDEYSQTAANIGDAARELNALIATFDEMLTSPGWRDVLPRLEATINRVGHEGEELIDHSFKQALLLILIALIGYILARLMVDKWLRQRHPG